MYLITQSQVCDRVTEGIQIHWINRQQKQCEDTNRLLCMFFYIQLFCILCAGTRKERGLVEWAADNYSGAGTVKTDTYDFPVGMGLVRKLSCLHYLPICPTFRGFKPSCRKYEEDEDMKIKEGVIDAPVEMVCTKI